MTKELKNFLYTLPPRKRKEWWAKVLCGGTGIPRFKNGKPPVYVKQSDPFYPWKG